MRTVQNEAALEIDRLTRALHDAREQRGKLSDALHAAQAEIESLKAQREVLIVACDVFQRVAR